MAANPRNVNFDDEDAFQAATQFSWSESDFEESPRPIKRTRLNNGTQHQNNFVEAREEQAQSVTPQHYRSAAQIDGSEDLLGVSDEESDAFDPPPPIKRAPLEQRPPQAHYVNRTPDTGYGSKKTKASIHIPRRAELLKDTYSTQCPPSSNPWTVRGPIWQKKAPVVRPKETSNSCQGNDGSKRSAQILNESTERLSHLRQSPPSKNFGARHDAILIDDELGLPQAVDQSGAKSGDPVIDIAQELADLPSDAFASSSPPPNSRANNAIYISSQPNPTAPNGVRLAAPLHGLRQKTLFGDTVERLGPHSQSTKRHNWPMAKKEEPPTHHKLNQDALKTWVYPTNLGTIRDYQFNITHRGLFHNLLVALPTGLGKTFIAATIMLNWYRWTKDAQIVFVAPTKPLVSQQVEACFGIAGIPRSETTMLTGGISPGLRAEEWNDKRVFFMTPQTIINDLKTGICDPKKIVLLVVDEAHRATGGYAYVEVVKFLRRFNQSFRVLALTATPGSNVEAVQQVIDGLDIARVEIRNENSLDIRQYVHTRDTDTVLFDFSDEQEMCMDMFSKVLQPLVNQLNGFNAYWGKDPMALTAYGLTQARAKWMSSDAGRRANWGLKGMVNRIITILARLAHAIELLKFHGVGPFYRLVLAFRNDVGSSKYEKQVNEHEEFNKLMIRLRGWINNDTFIGHPKLDYLQSVVLQHFINAGNGQSNTHGEPPSSTRIMVFAHYRDSVEEITRVLKRHEPMIRPHIFVGQAASKGAEGMEQKQQLDVIQKFKTGVYNTLVATSIGEEGLDIGEVDLIVCYDSSASPIRMLQRMGRTGRKRQGNIVLLLMRGKEENSFSQAKDNYEKMQAMIAEGDRFSFHEDKSTRIVPKEIQPVVDKRFVEIPKENTQPELPEPKRKGRPPKRPPKKFHMPDGVLTGFVKASRMDENEEGDSHQTPLSRQKREPQTLEDVEHVCNPPLAEVILGSAQEKELGRKYSYVCGDDDNNIVKPPRLDAFPQCQRSLRKSKLVGHGRISKRLVQTLTTIHNLDETEAQSLGKELHLSDVEPGTLDDEEGLDSDREYDQLQEQAPPKPAQRKRNPNPKPKVSAGKNKSISNAKKPNGPVAQQSRRGRPRKNECLFEDPDTAMDALESSPPPSSARMRLPSQAVDLGSDDTSGEDVADGEPSSELREFVVDDDVEVEVDGDEESLPTMSQIAGTAAGLGDEGEGEEEEEEEDDEDLLEAGQLVQTRITDPEMMGRGASEESGILLGPKRKRRLIEDSSD